MRLKPYLQAAAVVAWIVLFSAPLAQASHFRGGALIPSIDANKILTVDATSFWRPSFVGNTSSVQVYNSSGTAISSMTLVSTALDTADSRFTVSSQSLTFDLSNQVADTYTVRWTSCCRVDGIVNISSSGSKSNSLESDIKWDGSTAAKPIDFNFNSIQIEVGKNQAYNDNPNAVSPDGDAVSYALSTPLDQLGNPVAGFTQPPGFTIDAVTGNMNIPAANTALYTENPTANAGADYAYAFNIVATDSSGAETGRVQADWLWDVVPATSTQNRAPDVTDATINAMVGDVVMHTFVATDPDGDTLTWDAALFGTLGPVPAIAPVWDPVTGKVTWDSAGSAPGQYKFQGRVSDTGPLTAVGTYTVNLQAPTSSGVPEGGSSFVLLGLGLLGLLGMRVARKSRVLSGNRQL